MPIILDPDPKSTWGASDEYKQAWLAEYGVVLGDDQGPVENRRTYEELALAALAARTNSDGSAVLVSGAKKRWRKEFNDPTLSAWDVVTGAGMGDWTVVSGVATHTMGTTPNSESMLTSKESFTAPFTAQFGIKLSQKIANTEIYVEIVAETADGSALDESVVAAWRFAGSDVVTSTSARWEVRNGGAARFQSGTVGSQASQTVDAIYEIRLESDEVWFSSKIPNSTATKNTPAISNLISPDPNQNYRVRIRTRNGGTAPASSTTVTASFVTVVDYTEQQVNIVGGDASAVGANSIPVAITGGTVTVGTVNPAASATTIGTSLAKVFSAASTNATSVKATAARLYGINLANLTASWKFVRLYNQTTAPTVGTSVPVMVIALPPNSEVSEHYTVPITFATGLSYAITGAVADLDTTAVAVGDVVGSIHWL